MGSSEGSWQSHCFAHVTNVLSESKFDHESKKVNHIDLAVHMMHGKIVHMMHGKMHAVQLGP